MKQKKDKLNLLLNVSKKTIRQYFQTGPGWFYATIALLTLYFLIFQFNFVFSGDSWAEAFPEYVNDALTLTWTEIFSSGWAGYLTVIPATLTNIYIWVGLPLSSIDFYFRIITLIFTIFSIAFIAHPINRSLIKNDLIRVFIAFLLVLSFRHISALAFINIWYVGFFVIILVSLTKQNFTKKLYEWLYTAFAVLVALSKTSLVVIPFVLYRTIVKKKYISGALIISAAILQTLLTIFADTGYGGEDINFSIIDIIVNGFLSIGILTFKIIQVTPPSIVAVMLMSLAIIAMGVYLAYAKQFKQTVLIFFGLALSIYLHVFAPDNNFASLWTNYLDLYSDAGKYQREFLINFFILLIVGMFCSSLIISSKGKSKKAVITLVCLLGLVGLITVNPLNKIDITSAPVQTGMASSFKTSLDINESVCVPVPPTPGWVYKARWFFQFRGGCYSNTPQLPINYSSFNTPITKEGTPLWINATSKDELKTVVVAIDVDENFIGDVTLTDVSINKSFTQTVASKDGGIQFVSFNTTALGPRDAAYSLRLTYDGQRPIHTGTFENTNDTVMYHYFMGYPNIQ